MTNSFDEHLTISPAFIQQIRDLLEHLYDFPYQQRQTLVISTAETGYPSIEVAGPKVRKLLLDALEKIGEEKSLAFRSSQARFYNLLRLHYIEGMAVSDAARELGLSPRQTYRDLRSADEIIASIVWSQLIDQVSKAEGSPSSAPSAPAVGTSADTVARQNTEQQPSLQFQPANLNELVTTICAIVRPLAASHSVDLKLALPVSPAILPTDGMVARQVITGLLSMAIQKALPHPLEISLLTSGKEYLLKFAFRSAMLEEIADPSIDLYAQNLGWQIAHQAKPDQGVEIAISMQAHLRTCLIIDDHPGFVELLERYIADPTIYITTADNGRKGMEIARQLQPDVIILDVMIPEMDGWQVLQHLHSAPATKSIPIIVCSVFYDPDLALTLGAADVLKKPVRKEDLVKALKNLKIL